MATQPASHLERVLALAASARLLFIGGRRASATGESELTIYDHIAGKPAGVFPVPAHVLALAASETHVFLGCADGKVRILAHE